MKHHLISARLFSVKMMAALLGAGLIAGGFDLPVRAEEAAEAVTEEMGAAAENDSLVDIYCSQSAKDALGYEQLQTLIDLIVTSVEPQAVELLANQFPCFTQAAADGALGREIGLYIYYGTGDQDGISEHENVAPGSFAYVNGIPFHDEASQTLLYRYLICIDAETLTTTDDAGNAVLDPDGAARVQLDTTFCHELFHAFMDDYNRTGMSGYTDYLSFLYSPDELITTEEMDELFDVTIFPAWFMEGLAGCVGNIYPADENIFMEYRYDFDSGQYLDTCTNEQLLRFYTTQGYEEGTGDDRYDMEASSENNDDGHVNGATYVTGYMACLYLADLAYQQQEGSRGVTFNESGEIEAISSEKLREGISIILTRLHDGATLDEVINDLSGGVYENTDAFTKRFVKGTYNDETQSWDADTETLSFCVGYLNYMIRIDAQDPDTHPAGSMLMDDFVSTEPSPLTKGLEASSELYRFIEQNTMVDSTVSYDDLADGGKSYSRRDNFETVVAQFKESQQ